MNNLPNTLYILSPSTTTQSFHQAIKSQQSESTYTLFLPTKKTKQQEFEAVERLRQFSNLPSQNHITINISSIIQKTWRIINHYSPNDSVPNKNTPERTKAVKSIAKLNQSRLDEIESLVKDLVIQDQATKLNAKVKKL